MKVRKCNKSVKEGPKEGKIKMSFHHCLVQYLLQSFISLDTFCGFDPGEM